MSYFGNIYKASILDSQLKDPAVAAAYLERMSEKEAIKSALAVASQHFKTADSDLSLATSLASDPDLIADALISVARAVHSWCSNHIEGGMDDLKSALFQLENEFVKTFNDPAWCQPEVLEALKQRNAYFD